MFSRRTPVDLSPNRFTLEIARKRAAGASLIDLTESNPTRAGIAYPSHAILAALADPTALTYAPDPRGLLVAREAVATYYRDRGIAVDAARIVLTASTSEAYALLFKILGDAGDEVLVPVPSYPLFEHLVRIEGLVPIPYALGSHGGWDVDVCAVRAAITEHTRAIVVVSPNNPTGSTLKRDELAALVELCRERDLALVCDEVFADFVTREVASRVASVASVSDVLTFAPNGLSKVAGLPQLKLAWIVANGPASVLAEAVARLEFAADLFLSVGTPVQCALPALFAIAADVRESIRARVARNRARLTAIVGVDSPCDILPAEGGWYAIVRVPRLIPDEELVLDLVAKHDVVVHPGFFFDFEEDGLVVLSLLPQPDLFEEGARRLVRYVERLCAAGPGAA